MKRFRSVRPRKLPIRPSCPVPGAHSSSAGEALKIIQNLETKIEETGLLHLRACARLTAGKAWIAPPRHDEGMAEICLLDAIKASREQESKTIELRAATSLARLWQSQGKSEEAHDVLAPVYDWFTEGFDTTDLMDAKALLDELK